MPQTTRNGLKIFTTRENGIKYTKMDGSFYVRNANDGKLRLYTRKNKTGAIKKKTLTPSASSSSSRYSTAKSRSKSKSKSKSRSSSLKFYSAKSKSKSKSKSSSSSSASFRRNKTQKRRLTRSARTGKLNRKSCGKNRRTNRCRFVRGNERTSKNCHLSSRNRCVKVPKFNRTKCGHNTKTNRCRFLRRGRKPSKACKMSNGRCTKVSKSKRRKSKSNNKSWAKHVRSCMKKYNISYKRAASDGRCRNKYYLGHE